MLFNLKSDCCCAEDDYLLGVCYHAIDQDCFGDVGYHALDEDRLLGVDHHAIDQDCFGRDHAIEFPDFFDRNSTFDGSLSGSESDDCVMDDNAVVNTEVDGCLNEPREPDCVMDFDAMADTEEYQSKTFPQFGPPLSIPSFDQNETCHFSWPPLDEGFLRVTCEPLTQQKSLNSSVRPWTTTGEPAEARTCSNPCCSYFCKYIPKDVKGPNEKKPADGLKRTFCVCGKMTVIICGICSKPIVYSQKSSHFKNTHGNSEPKSYCIAPNQLQKQGEEWKYQDDLVAKSKNKKEFSIRSQNGLPKLTKSAMKSKQKKPRKYKYLRCLFPEFSVPKKKSKA